MKLIKATLFAVALLTGPLAFAAADTESMKQAEQLLQAIGMEKTLTLATAQIVDAQLQQNPSLAPFKNVMLEFFSRYMSFNSLKPEMVKAYAEAFTIAELKELNAFYGSALGKKAGQKMPAVMAEVAQMGTTRVQANISDLQAMIKTEAERLQKQQQQEQQGQEEQLQQ